MTQRHEQTDGTGVRLTPVPALGLRALVLLASSLGIVGAPAFAVGALGTIAWLQIQFSKHRDADMAANQAESCEARADPSRQFESGLVLHVRRTSGRTSLAMPFARSSLSLAWSPRQTA